MDLHLHPPQEKDEDNGRQQTSSHDFPYPPVAEPTEQIEQESSKKRFWKDFLGFNGGEVAKNVISGKFTSIMVILISVSILLHKAVSPSILSKDTDRNLESPLYGTTGDFGKGDQERNVTKCPAARPNITNNEVPKNRTVRHAKLHRPAHPAVPPRGAAGTVAAPTEVPENIAGIEPGLEGDRLVPWNGSAPSNRFIGTGIDTVEVRLWEVRRDTQYGHCSVSIVPLDYPQDDVILESVPEPQLVQKNNKEDIWADSFAVKPKWTKAKESEKRNEQHYVTNEKIQKKTYGSRTYRIMATERNTKAANNIIVYSTACYDNGSIRDKSSAFVERHFTTHAREKYTTAEEQKANALLNYYLLQYLVHGKTPPAVWEERVCERILQHATLYILTPLKYNNLSCLQLRKQPLFFETWSKMHLLNNSFCTHAVPCLQKR